MHPLGVNAFSCETERLSLRPVTDEHEAMFHALYTDAGTMSYIDAPMSVTQAVGAFREILRGMRRQPMRCVYLVILDKAMQEPLGICGMPQFAAGSASQEVGLLLTGGARSKGVAREALSALVNRNFEVTSISEVRAQFAGGNLAAQRLLVAVGFSPCNGVDSGQEFSSRRCWSIHRSSWRCSQSSQLKGMNDVKRDRFS